MESPALLVVCTFPDPETAEITSRTLLDKRLVACANLLPGVRSIYRWEGRVEEASEVLVLFKTTKERWTELRDLLTELHPYEVPEILAFPAVDGLPAYLSWVGESVAPE